MTQVRNREWLAFVLLGGIWGSSFLWIKIAVADIGPFLLVAIRLAFGIFSLLVAAFLTRSTWPKESRIWLSLTFLGLINNAIPYLLISWGEKHIDSSMAAILNSTAPLFTMIIAHQFLNDDRMDKQRFGGLLLGFAGIIILFNRGEAANVQNSTAGKLAILLAALSYAFASVYARRTTKGLSPAMQALLPLLGADLLIWGITPSVESPLSLPQEPITWLALAWLGILGVGAAYWLYFYLLHNVGPTRTTLVTYVFPLVGVVLGVIFLGERLDWHLFLGASFVVGSIIVVNHRR